MSALGVETAFSSEKVNVVGLLSWGETRAAESRMICLIFRTPLSSSPQRAEEDACFVQDG